MKFFWAILLLFLGSISAKAQFNTCIDSGRINPLFQCNDIFYDPVCGCDGKTYRNQCDAYNVHGVTTWRGGVCAGLNLDFFPNPVGPNSSLTINVSFPEFVYGNADVKIVDMYGKVWEQRIINNFNRMNFQFDTRSLMTGVYFIVIRDSLGSSTVKMFAKY